MIYILFSVGLVSVEHLKLQSGLRKLFFSGLSQVASWLKMKFASLGRVQLDPYKIVIGIYMAIVID